MKKSIKLLSIAFILGAFFMSCEGPEGPAGDDGMDASAECKACHNAGTAFTAKQAQFNVSAHSLGTYFTRDGQCAGCHSTEGFLARMDHTSIAQIDDLGQDNQSPISCRTCHYVHTMYDSTDWALTFTDQVTETILGYESPDIDSYSFDDMGDANMCLQCHQSRDRGNVPSLTTTADVTISLHWGPHYGVQGNVIHSTGGIKITGAETYPSSAVRHDCISCHMVDGDHTLAVNFDACEECHTDMEGTIETVQDEVHDLLFALGKSLSDLGAMGPDVEGTDTVGYHPAGGYSGVAVPVDQARAVWNYMVVYQDHSYGAHNSDYIIALLKNTQAMVNGL